MQHMGEQHMTAPFKNIGVIGAGQMGCGIAHVSAIAGYRVHIYDLSKEGIEAGLATINGNLARQVTNGKLSDEARKQALTLIKEAKEKHDFPTFIRVRDRLESGIGAEDWVLTGSLRSVKW